MTDKQQVHRTPSTHLPSKQQNIFYILVLVASPLLNLFVRSIVHVDTRHAAAKANLLPAYIQNTLAASGVVFGSILVLLGINIAQSLLLHHRRARHSMLMFGIFSSLYLLMNLLTISYGIYVFKIQSYLLLVISICVYLSVNINFLFWYWYVDYPTQIRRIHHPDSEVQVQFPEQPKASAGWIPDFLDYLYFTVMASNTLGAPENHSPNGRAAKLILILHSSTMMVLLVIFVSRAINTLS